MDIKENLAYNLTQLRKEAGLTQAELAEKLNYSDKAVSKWERAESVPDLYVLKQIADFYNVTIDSLIGEPCSAPVKKFLSKNKVRAIVATCSTLLVWLVAVCVFSFLDIIIPKLANKTWLAFIYALPVSFIVLLVFMATWKKRITSSVMTSLLVWTAILAVFLTLKIFLPNPPPTLWEIFLIGIPLQVLVIIWFIYRKHRN